MPIRAPADSNSTPVVDHPYPRRWLALGILLCATFMNLLDVTIVNIALPPIQTALGASDAAIERIVAGYVLVFALALLPAGRLGDKVGKKRLFLVGVTGFTIASGLCGVASGTGVLIAARLLQGLMAAVMIPQVLSLTHIIFDREEQGRAFSLFGVATGLATVSGPIIGGALIGSDLLALGWRSIFLINLPIGLFAIIAGSYLVPPVPVSREARMDAVGIGIVTVAMTLIIFPLIEGRSHGWPAWCWASMTASIPVLHGFVRWERRQEGRGGAQLLPYTLMTNRNFVVGGLLAMALFSTIPGLFLCAALLLQLGFGFTPLASGLATVPFSVGVLVTSMLAGRLGRFAARPRLVCGIVTMAVGVEWLRWVVTRLHDVLSSTMILPPLLLAGLGFGVTVTVLFKTILSGVPHHDSGAGSGALQALQQLGAAFGVAIASGLFFTRLGASIDAGTEHHAAYAGAFGMTCAASLVGYGVAILAALTLQPGDERRRGREPVLEV
jgi:EmrB/QacA subfamily drug resistance transporter